VKKADVSGREVLISMLANLIAELNQSAQFYYAYHSLSQSTLQVVLECSGRVEAKHSLWTMVPELGREMESYSIGVN
jgi:hypothetical protein